MFGLPLGGGFGVASIAGDIGEVAVVLVDVGQVQRLVDAHALAEKSFRPIEFPQHPMEDAKLEVRVCGTDLVPYLQLDGQALLDRHDSPPQVDATRVVPSSPRSPADRAASNASP